MAGTREGSGSPQKYAWTVVKMNSKAERPCKAHVSTTVRICLFDDLAQIVARHLVAQHISDEFSNRILIEQRIRGHFPDLCHRKVYGNLSHRVQLKKIIITLAFF